MASLKKRIISADPKILEERLPGTRIHVNKLGILSITFELNNEFSLIIEKSNHKKIDNIDYDELINDILKYNDDDDFEYFDDGDFTDIMTKSSGFTIKKKDLI